MLFLPQNIYKNLIIKYMCSENTHKYQGVTMTEYTHDLIVVLNNMLTPRPYDAINSYHIIYDSLYIMENYTDALRTIVNSPKAPLVFPCKKELLKLLKLLEQENYCIYWRSEDNMFDIKKYGVERYLIIQKKVRRIIYHLRAYMCLGKLCRWAFFIGYLKNILKFVIWVINISSFLY